MTMSWETYSLIAKTEMGWALVVFFLGLIRFRSNIAELKLLCIWAGVSFVCDLAPLYHTELNIKVNYFGTAYRLLEFILFLLIYYKAFGEPRRRTAYIILSVFYIAFQAYNVAYVQRDKINSYTQIVLAAIFIVLAVEYFYKLMRELPTLQLQRLPMFWINVGVLVYFAGNLFLWIVSHYLVTVMNDNLMIYWSFHNCLSSVQKMLFTVALIVNLRHAQKAVA